MRARGSGRFIAFEGPTGVGKTTLVQRISGQFAATAMWDPYAGNPFLECLTAASTDEARARWALPTELTFLALRVTELRRVATSLAAGCTVVADWSMIKQLVFGGLTLDAPDSARLAHTCALWAADLPVPDLVVYLRADVATLRARILQRGRPMEAGITDAHLADLSRRYDCTLTRARTRILTVNAAAFDVFNDAAVSGLAGRIRAAMTSKEVDYVANGQR